MVGCSYDQKGGSYRLTDKRAFGGWDDYACYDGRAILKLVSQCLYLIDGVQVTFDGDKLLAKLFEISRNFGTVFDGLVGVFMFPV